MLDLDVRRTVDVHAVVESRDRRSGDAREDVNVALAVDVHAVFELGVGDAARWHDALTASFVAGPDADDPLPVEVDDRVVGADDQPVRFETNEVVGQLHRPGDDLIALDRGFWSGLSRACREHSVVILAPSKVSAVLMRSAFPF
ncbi:MAG: hypothetical protein M3527_08325 [Actinomycetota bacterium]|nr:hypothetical protein [Actinomycetota bacterium]